MGLETARWQLPKDDREESGAVGAIQLAGLLRLLAGWQVGSWRARATGCGPFLDGWHICNELGTARDCCRDNAAGRYKDLVAAMLRSFNPSTLPEAPEPSFHLDFSCPYPFHDQTQPPISEDRYIIQEPNL